MKYNSLLYSPIVYAVENEYQIFIKVKEEAAVSVGVGEERFYDHSNGVLRTAVPIHKITVPMNLLDEKGEYTVFVQTMVERKAKFTVARDVESETFKFESLVNKENIGILHLADVHGRKETALAAANAVEEKIDLLILNGDIVDNSSSAENFEVILELCSKIAGGSIPCIFSRGNHDLRGVCAEKLCEYTPTHNVKSYYTFRTGNLWGLLLDCGEDKPDNHEEYGSTVVCELFRKEETEFLKEIANEKAFEKSGIRHRLVIAHNPFTRRDKPPFDIEENTYRKWCEILRNDIKPDAILCGHTHFSGVFEVGGFLDTYGQPCPVILGSEMMNKGHENEHFCCAHITLSPEGINTVFYDKNGRAPATAEENYD